MFTIHLLLQKFDVKALLVKSTVLYMQMNTLT